jgi:hypothetical protein
MKRIELASTNNLPWQKCKLSRGGWQKQLNSSYQRVSRGAGKKTASEALRNCGKTSANRS